MLVRRLTMMFVIAACGESPPHMSLISNQPGATPELRAACAHTEHKCTRCHTIGRVLTFDATTREEWEPLVTRMRRMPASGITRADADLVLTCLVTTTGQRTAR